MHAGLSHQFKQRCQSLGFTSPYVARLNQGQSLDQYGTKAEGELAGYLERGYHGTMTWMSETALRRSRPNNLWPQAASAIVLGMNYGPSDDPLAGLLQKHKASISVYARGKDYHGLIKGRLKELAGLLARDTGADVKVFVDTAPLMEKPLAQQAGLGWQGKHTNLVSRDFGSWLFLGVILSAAELKPNAPLGDNCGSCRACLDICPTDAFPKPYQIDARKCISYLTIEHKGPVDLALREKLGNRIYGCDDCLAACPWNKFAQTASEAKFWARSELKAPDLAALSRLSDPEFRNLFSGSPIKRIGRDQFLRNVLYAIGNSKTPKLISAAQAHRNADNPTVRDAAIWATQRLHKLKS